MSFVRKSFAPRAGAGTEITPDKVLDNYYGFNRLLELKQGAMGDSQWDAVEANVVSGKKYGKTGGATGTGTGVITVTDKTLADSYNVPYNSGWVTKKTTTMAAGETVGIAFASVNRNDDAGSNYTVYTRILYDGVQKAYISTSTIDNIQRAISWVGAVESGKDLVTQLQSGGTVGGQYAWGSTDHYGVKFG
jgi:hypothetical protein